MDGHPRVHPSAVHPLTVPEVTVTLTPQRAPRSTRFWWIVGSAGVLAMTAFIVWLGLAGGTDRVSWNDAGFQIEGEASIDVRFDVVRDPAREVVCRLEALDDNKAFVGSREVSVPPGTERRSRHIATVQTIARARTGYVDLCWYADDVPAETPDQGPSGPSNGPGDGA